MADITLRPATPEDIEPMDALIWATGPSYEYMFKGREIFDIFINEAWITPNVTFSYTEATLAVRDGEILGLELGSKGDDWYKARNNMKIVSQKLYETDQVSSENLLAIAKRSYQASFLNPYTPSTAYYTTALSVVDAEKGEGIGRLLLEDAKRRAKEKGARQYQLDVFSNNQAVGFYRSMGLECVAETVSPALREAGIPMEMRMVVDLKD